MDREIIITATLAKLIYQALKEADSFREDYQDVTLRRNVMEQLESKIYLEKSNPDWSSSNTLPTELWKNPMLPITDRLLIADGAVFGHKTVADRLRKRLEEAENNLAIVASDTTWQPRQ